MPTIEPVITRGTPEALLKFVSGGCGVPMPALRPVAAEAVPEPDQRLLVHPHDMTSTLAAYHGSALKVQVLQQQVLDGLYLREVFLRTARTNRIVEYGVIAIVLEQFAPAQQEEILAGRAPLGALLHEFRIGFESSPIGFFSIASRDLLATALASPGRSVCYGRFNRLAKANGEPLAWIMEILPNPGS